MEQEFIELRFCQQEEFQNDCDVLDIHQCCKFRFAEPYFPLSPNSKSFEVSLDSLRYKHYCSKVASNTTHVQPHTLPPTSTAAKCQEFSCQLLDTAVEGERLVYCLKIGDRKKVIAS